MDYTPTALFRQTRAFGVVRSSDWQGAEARAGARLGAAPDGDVRGAEMLPLQETAAPEGSSHAKPASQSSDMWERIEALLGAQRGQKIVQLVKEHIQKHVRSLSLADIERMS